MATTEKSARPDPRGSVSHEEDPRERARRRAAEVRGHLGSMDDGTDEFIAPPAPAGWTYEWKRKTLLGQEDPAYQVALVRMGWEPVPASRHPEMMPGNGNFSVVERKGMVLMERPTELVEEARMIERRRAQSQVRTKEQQLNGAPEGGLGHRDHSAIKPKISKSFEALPIPE